MNTKVKGKGPTRVVVVIEVEQINWSKFISSYCIKLVKNYMFANFP